MPGPQPRGYTVTTVRLPQDDLAWAQRRAADLDVSVSWVIRDALKSERLVVEAQGGDDDAA